jgi:pyrimidine operon attenuation protein/uracil phosphoribosyltransferase
MNPASTRLPNLHVKGRLMSGSEIERTLVRLAHQIVEKNNGVENLVLVGIKRRGVPLASRLAALIQQIEKTPVPVGTLDITLYRDDLSTVGTSPLIKKATPLGTNIVDKNVILLDDVLYTGRTIRASLDALFDQGRPARVQLLVLIDRGWRELPVEARYIGRTVQTAANEIIEVKFQEIDGMEKVLLVERVD